jgi:hypothetical protein
MRVDVGADTYRIAQLTPQMSLTYFGGIESRSHLTVVSKRGCGPEMLGYNAEYFLICRVEYSP